MRYSIRLSCRTTLVRQKSHTTFVEYTPHLRAAGEILGVSQKTIWRWCKLGSEENVNRVGRPREGTLPIRKSHSPPRENGQKTLDSWCKCDDTEKIANYASVEGRDKTPKAPPAPTCEQCGGVLQCQQCHDSPPRESDSGRFLSVRLTATGLVLPAGGGKFRRYTRTLLRGHAICSSASPWTHNLSADTQSDCGLFAITNGFEIVSGGEPGRCLYDCGVMRKHLASVLIKQELQPFPKDTIQQKRDKVVVQKVYV